MTTVRAASSATLSVALVPRRATAVLQRAAHREVAVQEEVLREAVHQEVLHPETEAQEVALREAVLQEVRRRETLAVAVVAPPAMTTMITTHRAAVAEGEGDSFFNPPPFGHPLKRGTRKATQSLRPVGSPF